MSHVIDAYPGIDTVSIHHRRVGRKLVVEVIDFDENRRAIRGSACHGPDAR